MKANKEVLDHKKIKKVSGGSLPTIPFKYDIPDMSIKYDPIDLHTEVPEIKIPDIKIPEIKMPEIKMPEIKMPDIEVLTIDDVYTMVTIDMDNLSSGK